MGEQEKTYCVNCERVIKTNSLNNFAANMAGEPLPQEYKDGWYCGTCNKLKLEKAKERLK